MSLQKTWRNVLAGTSLAVLTACAATAPPRPAPQFTVDAAVFEATPPAPATASPSDKISDVVLDDVRVEPEKATGYENLPESITQLYDLTPLDLSLGQVVNETLANNRQIRIQEYSMRIADYEIPVSKSIYDLMMTASAGYTMTEDEGNSSGIPGIATVQVDQTRVLAGSAAISQLLPSGAVIALGHEIMRSASDLTIASPILGWQWRTSGAGYEQRTTLNVTQPLLKGFGSDVTNAGIHIAQQERRGSAADFQTQVEDQLVNSLQTYWTLIGAIETYKVYEISYAAALDLLRINKAKYDQDVAPLTDVLQAEAAAENRREQVIQARQMVRDLEDELKMTLFLTPDEPAWGEQIHPTQPIAWREIDVNLSETIETAMARRAELRRSDSNIRQAEINERVARNGLKPTLNLFASVDNNGSGDNVGDTVNSIDSGDYVGYAAGLEFSMPLQNRQARYQLRQAKTAVELQKETRRAVEDAITLSVRQAHRALRTARERIEVTQSLVRSEEAKLASERKRYDVGVSTAYQVLDFQEDLAAAQSQHISAVIDYNTAAVALDRARGTLLDSLGVTVSGADLNPSIEPVGFPIGWN